MASIDDLPTYADLMLPTLQAVDRLGGSASVRQIRASILDELQPPEEWLAITYPGRDVEKGVYLDRLDWARSYCKLGGALDSPKRGLFLITELGTEILSLPPAEGRERLKALDQEVRRRRYSRSKVASDESDGSTVAHDDEPDEWRQQLLNRLHQMSPTAFEKFVLHVLRTFDLELEHRGGTGDDGIDGIGTAQLTPVLSATVAVQVKRYDPNSAIGRDAVALFQRDAGAVGAERAIMVTLGRFTSGAERASQVTTPTVDLIDGERLCDLVQEQEVEGLRLVYEVVPDWFDRFESRG